MNTGNASHGFTAVSDRIATLTIQHGSSSFGLRADAAQQIYRLGMFEQPLFELRQPFSPDERWYIVASGAEAFPPDDCQSEDLEKDYARWAHGSRASDSRGILGCLPVGNYLLLRCHKAPLNTKLVLMGNEFVPADPNVAVIYDESPFYACIIGARDGVAPDLSQPLIGVTVLNYDGSPDLDCVLFFSCAPPRSDGAEGNSKDLVVVVPTAGDLVIDNMAVFSPEGERRSRERWSSHRAHQFKAALTTA